MTRLKKVVLKPIDDVTKSEGYYQLLDVLEMHVQHGIISEKLYLNFKAIIRDYKYIATYMKALDKNLQGIDSIADYNKRQSDFRASHDWDLQPDWNVRNLIEFAELSDPIKIIKSVVRNAMEREGKICDFRDTARPETKFGFCENDNHEGENSKQTLYLTLYVDEDTAKYDDNSTVYICKECMDNLENDCEVSCDMG